MSRYILAVNVGVILIFFSCIGSFVSAQPIAQSANTSMSGSNNTTSSSTNMTISQAIKTLSCLTGQVCITSIQTLPTFIQVNDAIGFMVGVTNNSSKTITFNTICPQPITAKFDSHVILQHTAACFAIGTQSIQPHGHATVYGPPSGIVYRAISPALPAHAVVTFTYHTTTGLQWISKAFAFDIFP